MAVNLIKKHKKKQIAIIKSDFWKSHSNFEENHAVMSYVLYHALHTHGDINVSIAKSLTNEYSALSTDQQANELVRAGTWLYENIKNKERKIVGISDKLWKEWRGMFFYNNCCVSWLLFLFILQIYRLCI